MNNNMKCWLKRLVDDNERSASCAEGLAFIFALISLLIFVGWTLIRTAYRMLDLVLFLPVLFYLFIRTSRKDMMATSNLLAAILGSAITLVATYFRK